MAKKHRKLFKQKGSNNWYCQFGFHIASGRRVTYKKSLGTPDKEVAWTHYDEIASKIDDLKSGMRFKWSWERHSKHTEVKVQTVQDAFDKYLKAQEINGLKPETILGTKDAYRRLIESKCASPALAVKSLKGIKLEDFKAYWLGKHSPNTISQGLNKIKAFLNYCVDKRWMSNYKTVSSPLKAKAVSYFTDDEFKVVMENLESGEKRRRLKLHPNS